MSARTTASVADKADCAVVGHALDAVNVAAFGVSFLNDHIHPAVNALVELSKFDSMDLSENRVRMGMIAGIAKLCLYLVEDSAGCLEGELDEMKGKLELLKGGAA